MMGRRFGKNAFQFHSYEGYPQGLAYQFRYNYRMGSAKMIDTDSPRDLRLDGGASIRRALSASPDEEHGLAEAIATARGRAGMTQEEVAQRMQTTQSNIARLEAGRTIPSTRTLKKFAAAIGARLYITFERTDR